MKRGAVLFDVYGTLLHFRVERRPFATLMRGLALDRQDALRLRSHVMAVHLPTLGDAAQAITALTAQAVSDSVLRLARRELDEHLDSCFVDEGAFDLLERLRERGHALALVSNLASPYVAPIERLGLRRLVDHAAYSCELGVLKPDPAIFRAALDALGVDPTEATMVGNSRGSDVLGARQAGLHALWLTRGGDVAAGCVRELAQVIDALSGSGT